MYPRLEWIIGQEPDGALIPTWVDAEGVPRHVSERPDDAGE